MAKVVQPAGVRRLAGAQPFLARLAAFPRARGEAEDLDLDPAQRLALELQGHPEAALDTHKEK